MMKRLFSDRLMKKYGKYVLKALLNRWKATFVGWWVKPDEYAELKQFCRDNLAFPRLKELAKEFEGTNDQKIIDILKFVHGWVEYKPDYEVWGTLEYWEDAQTVYDNRVGDCESGALLILTLARHAGIPPEQIFIETGLVYLNRQEVGHAWIRYVSDNGVDYIIDWCYHYDDSSIPEERYIASRKSQYLKTWFLVNDVYAYR
jgi:predicted transglutaminase-like cysteine proteinase